jgi:ComF family protein
MGRAGAICGACLKEPPHFDATLALFAYAFPVEHFVQGLKYQGRLPLARFFAACFTDSLAKRADRHIDCIAPLPLHPLRLKERGFNQSMEIARPLAQRLNLPLLASACSRQLDTAPQTSLPWKARGNNVRGAFHCNIDLSGKTIAVVDDVMTTGATLNEFARTLKKHGAAHVTNWVAARALRK